jgi:hypothetical protein
MKKPYMRTPNPKPPCPLGPGSQSKKGTQTEKNPTTTMPGTVREADAKCVKLTQYCAARYVPIAIYRGEKRSAQEMRLSSCLEAPKECMKTRNLLFMKTQLLQKVLIVWLSVPLVASAQGTFVFDQQSSDESNGGSGGTTIQNFQPMGQSFTPSLNGIGFVRLNLLDENRNNGQGATIYVNLRSGSIAGTIMSSTAPVALPDNFGLPLNTGYVTFLFPTEIPLQPGTIYFLQPVVQSGDLFAAFGGSFGYSGGDLYANGIPSTTDLWFREGIIVPEPSAPMLVGSALAICVLCRRLRAY